VLGSLTLLEAMRPWREALRLFEHLRHLCDSRPSPYRG
jgi:hypothetical protein